MPDFVISASCDGSCGNKVVVRQDGGTETWYALLNTIESQVGQAVEAGTLIGTVGSTRIASPIKEGVAENRYIVGVKAPRLVDATDHLVSPVPQR